MDMFVDEFPKKINSDIFLYHEFFKNLYESSSFSIHDESIRTLLSKSDSIRIKILSYDQYYVSIDNQYYVFVIEGDVFRDDVTERDFNYLNEQRHELFKVYTTLLDEVKSKFIDIKFDETNKLAYKQIR